MRLTIKDIADLARVSKGTVSKALNDKPGVGQATRKRIFKLIEQMDFHPNSAARALAVNKTNTIGLVIPHEAGQYLMGAYWSALITAIAEEAVKEDYHLILLTPHHEGDIESAYNTVLKRKLVDGLIVGSELLDKKAVSSLSAYETPFVLLGKSPDAAHCFVDVDNLGGAAAMTAYMIARGFRRIAFLSGPQKYPYNRERKQGFEHAMRQSGLSPDLVYSAAYSTDDVLHVIKRIAAEPDLEALFIGAGGDFMLDSVRALRECHKRINDFGFTVFDDYPFLEYMEPRVTAVSQPIKQLGVEAVKILFLLMNKQVPEEPYRILPTTIVPRNSCGE